MVGKEYVPVVKSTFSEISLKLVTNLTTMELFDSPYEVLVVLHFQPRHKRPIICVDSYLKRACLDGQSERTIQQAFNSR